MKLASIFFTASESIFGVHLKYTNKRARNKELARLNLSIDNVGVGTMAIHLAIIKGCYFLASIRRGDYHSSPLFHRI